MPEYADRDVILCYGHDETLLLTRQKVLEMIGIPVSSVSKASEFRAKLLSMKPAVILLCQSLSPEECMDASAFAESASPSSKVLMMYSQPGKCQLAREHVELYWGDGPVALVSTVKRLLSNPEPGRQKSL
jgi:hypothetical protein